MRERLMPRLRRAARVLISGRDSRFYEDEMIGFNLNTLTPSLDSDFTGRRLNILTSSLSASKAFGGLATLIDMPMQVFKQGLAEEGWHLRFICTGQAPVKEDNIATQYQTRLGIDAKGISQHFLSGDGASVPVARGDMFLGSLWYSQIWAQPLMQFQNEQFGGPKVPYISMMQDYEAGFHPWSSAFVLAHASYESTWPKRIIFNSKELADFYKAQGHEFEESYAFEPVLNSSLRDALTVDNKPGKERRIIFYGRPNSRRNCFFLAKEALKLWAEQFESAPDWQVISVGADYDAFSLPRSVPLNVLGKLTLEQYANELHKAAVGMSLMASPHPSYPPLEMAHFGAMTVCNRFDCKDPSEWHENLRPVEINDPQHLAQALTEACRAFEVDRTVGLSGRTRKPHYLKDSDPALLDNIANMIMRAPKS